MRVCGGAGFWLGGATGGGIATTQNFGVWTGNGPGLKNFTISRGAWLDAVNANRGSVSGLTSSGAYVQMRLVGETASGNLVFVNPVSGSARVKPADGSAYIQWVEFDTGGGGRNYGGDGSGSLMDNTLRVMDAINQWNPMANFMDLVSNGFYVTDRLGNKLSQREAWMKAGGMFPVTRVGDATVKTLQLTSKVRTAEQGLLIGERFLGKGYQEIHPGIGVFRSSDGLRQFRMTNGIF